MKPPVIPGVGFYEEDDGKGGKFYRVRLGKRFTGGEVQRKAFLTLKEAVEWVYEKQGSKKVHGESYFDFTPAQVAEARDAFERLDGRATLTDAVSYYIKHALPVRGKRTFAKVAEEFLTSRRAMGCKETTMNQYESQLSVVGEEWGEVNVNEFKVPDIEDWISESDWEPRTRKNYLVTLTTVFNFAIKREYCATNPAEKIDRPILDDKPPGILTLEQACGLLTRSMDEDPEMTDGLSIGLFAGLRRSDLCALDWAEIKRDRKLIEVKASKAKTRQRRLVTISDNLDKWLARNPQKSGPVVYRLVDGKRQPLSVDMFGERLKELIRVRPKSDEDEGRPALVDPWPHNAIRHSFGSYYYGKTKNENFTAAEMGNSPQIVIKCYRELVEPKPAEAYWYIVPVKGAAKIVLPNKK